ncbi:MAG: DNA gyrase subunit A [Candidatus Omnitrophica bacterium]|nr:DNA gyrase subunit A [Candidatus Omnitrophota bacterium]
MYTAGEKIKPIYIEDEMKDSYISYAMSVIVGRALPDVKDGLKPVHRRILFAMKDLGLEHNKPYKKAARIVGEVLGKYHPHGDQAVYDALVRMVQDFSLRYPLIDGQGNFGSVDGDAPAAMRYTEARFSSITQEMLADIEKETVEFVPNFDESLLEPEMLPARLPNLIVNGSSGIAVGMATNIPPHNLGEVVDGVVYLIDHPDCSVKDLMKYITGPDFPTGALISGVNGIKQAYHTGRGVIKLHAKAYVEQLKGNKEAIVISEIPYQVNKASLIESIAALVQSKKIEGISDIRDESDKEGLRVVIDLKRDANSQVIMNQLYKHTQMQTSFGVIMLALVDGKPQTLNLKQLLAHFIDHRKDIIIRRTQFDLARAQERAHILEGLKIALANLDKVIKVIRTSKSVPEAKESLMSSFKLSDKQAQAILEMQLQRLTRLEREKIDEEYLDLIKKIQHYESILASERKVLEIIKAETEDLKKKYGDARRTQIVAEVTELELEDLIAKEDAIITISHAGYIKRLPVSSYRKQRRGGVGVTGGATKDEDFIEDIFIASTHDYILFFTDKGKAHWLKVYDIPQASRQSKGKAIVNLLELAAGEKITAYVPVGSFEEGKYLVMATQKGLVKKTQLTAYANPRKGGIIGIGLEAGDELIAVNMTDGKDEIFLATAAGKAIRFSEAQVRDMGRSARGVRGIRLDKKDEVIGMETVREDATILSVAEKGFGKRTQLSQYRAQSRGGKGIINIKATPKTGRVVSIKTVRDDDELLLVTQGAMVVRFVVRDIRSTGRSAQGVRIIRLKGNDRVASVAPVPFEEQEEA